MITKCVYNLFLALERICRNSLVGFSDLQSVVYTSVYVAFLNKFLYDICPISCITVLYDSRGTVMQLISTVWKIQYAESL